MRGPRTGCRPLYRKAILEGTSFGPDRQPAEEQEYDAGVLRQLPIDTHQEHGPYKGRRTLPGDPAGHHPAQYRRCRPGRGKTGAYHDDEPHYALSQDQGLIRHDADRADQYYPAEKGRRTARQRRLPYLRSVGPRWLQLPKQFCPQLSSPVQYDADGIYAW